MMPVSQGKPCAGNPHARFEEGASAPVNRGGVLYSTKESVRQRKRHADRKAGCAEMHRRSFASEGTSPKATRRARKRVRDRRAEAQPYKGMSQTKVKSRMYASKLLTERSPVVKRVMVTETNTDAAKSLRNARRSPFWTMSSEGRGTGFSARAGGICTSAHPRSPSSGCAARYTITHIRATCCCLSVSWSRG